MLHRRGGQARTTGTGAKSVAMRSGYDPVPAVREELHNPGWPGVHPFTHRGVLCGLPDRDERG